MKRWRWVVSVFVVLGLMLSGCGGGADNNDSGNGGGTTTYSISGMVTVSGAALSGVAVALTGASSASATTDSGGNYSFSGLANGSYTVTPSKSGYTFSPSSTAVTVNGANVSGQNFTATASTAATYTITGQVTLSGTGLTGVTMTLSGASSASATTDSGGNYSFSGLANGSYTVTPSLTGYTFTPTSAAVTVNGANVSGQNFTATASTAATYSITGQVTLNGSGLTGVTMTLSGASSASATTDSGGNYSFSGLANGSYTVMPSKSGYTFSPSSTAVTVNGANVSGQNFTATAASTSSSWRLLKLPDTGQASHYSTATGDDADYSINPPSFTDNGDGTIIDNVTTLVWQKCSMGQSGTLCSTGAATTYDWYEASGVYDATSNPSTVNVCGSLDLDGYTDWRLPNDIELMSIVNYGTYSPAIDATYFPNTQASSYWSSSTLANDPGYAWIVYFYTGYVYYGYYKTDAGYVRCVRGGQ